MPLLMALFLSISPIAVFAAEAPQTLIVNDFTSLDSISATPWPDKGGAAPTSEIDLAAEKHSDDHPSALRIDYKFPSEQCTQVKIDLSVPPCANYAALEFDVRGDGSGNELQVWTGEQARGWHGAEKTPLDFEGWRHLSVQLEDNYTTLARTLRFIIRQDGGLGEHTVYLDDVKLAEPIDKPLPDDFAIGPKVADKPPFERSREFKRRRRQYGDRTAMLVDDEPLMCVLDAQPSAQYLNMARQAGINCFALDLYWRDLEPVEGFDRWGPLREFVDWLGQAGFGVVMLVNIHQPRWLLAQRADEPLQGGTLYPNAPIVRTHFESFLNRFLPEFQSAENLLAIGLSAGGEADVNFPEVPGQRTEWRDSPALLADFRAYLGGKYDSDGQWRGAWNLEDNDAKVARAQPPQPKGKPDEPWTDLRRSWHDWRAFIDQWWIGVTKWQAQIVKKHLPETPIMVRFGWPVFQCENVFLIRRAPHIDLIQCKDAVASWEAATPWFLVSRAALYHGAVRGTDKVSFHEVDVGHNRGRPDDAGMRNYLPPLAPFIGALWYYRGLHQQFIAGLGDALSSLKQNIKQPMKPKIAIFYGQKYANWTQNHSNYYNEAALAGATRLLATAGLQFTVVSEYTLDDLSDMKYLILADNPILPADAADAIAQWQQGGGRLIVEKFQRRDLNGEASQLQVSKSALTIPAGFFASIQPRGAGLRLNEKQTNIAKNVRKYLGVREQTGESK